MNHLANLEENDFYHIFNRTNNKEVLFRSDGNKLFFLQQMEKYLAGFIEIYSFSLLPNHFHISMSVKSKGAILKSISEAAFENRTKKMHTFLENEKEESHTHDLISHQFQRLFISYSQAYNKMFRRKGNLFNRPFKRVLLKNEDQFALNQYYIHHNARKHGLVKKFDSYKWDSYKLLLSNEQTFLNRDYVFDFFGGRQAFKEFHETSHLEREFKDIYIED